LEYEHSISGKTPDWYDAHGKLLLEVLTCERGGSSPPVDRVADGIATKVEKYSDMVLGNELSFVVAVHGDFETFFDAEDCKMAISKGNLFEHFMDLSGVIFFAESRISITAMPDGSRQRQQQYGYEYFANLKATRKVDLSSQLHS
jgi:hypothetical protein